MQTEQVRYIGIDPQVMREKLVNMMGICLQPERLTRQYEYDAIHPDTKAKTGTVALQVADSRIEMTYQSTDDSKPPVRVGVSDFETAHLFLTSIGMNKRMFQEIKRETWEVGVVKAHIETLPWLDPFLVIEAASQNQIQELAEKLGLSSEQKHSKELTDLYLTKYGIDASVFLTTPELMFMKRPEWLKR